MAELTPRDRLQPSLLDRLSDDEPEKQQESRQKRVLSPQKLREVVLRDLAWLFNTNRLESFVDLDEHPHVARSVVNYGLPDLAGHTASAVDIAAMERMVRQAIVDFEPRILPRSIKVTATRDVDEMSFNALTFEIEGDLWSVPVPLQLYMKTEIDLETGDVEVQESSRPGDR